MTPASALVHRAIDLSRTAADRGDADTARRAWGLAERLSLRCGGISGPAWSGDYGAIVLQGGFVAVSPVPLVERVAR